MQRMACSGPSGLHSGGETGFGDESGNGRQKSCISWKTKDCVVCSVLVSGILHKGNGENQFVSQQPPVIGSVMGNGRRRSISCPSCNGLADGNKLLAPVALTCGSDGSLYVGDFNYIRRIFPSGNVTNILELRYVR